MNRKKYSVCFLLDKTVEYVLLQKKNKTIFEGMYNGVGGKIEPGEIPSAGALREIKEETGVELKRKDLHWIATLTLPQDCDAKGSKELCVLHFYSAIVDLDLPAQQPGETEALRWFKVDEVLWSRVMDTLFAGKGDLPYIVYQAVLFHRGET